MIGCVGILLLISMATAEKIPAVYWSMEKFDSSTGSLLPDIGDPKIYSGRLVGLFSVSSVPGFHGYALRIDSAEVTIGYLPPPAGNCFTDPMRCEDTGLSLGMWLRIEYTGSDEINCIFTSSRGCSLSDPGVSLYQNAGSKDEIHSVVRLTNGTLYTASCYVERRRWVYLTLTWNLTDGIKLYSNCTGAKYTALPAVYHNNGQLGENIKINIGGTANGHVITLDDLALWFKQLLPQDVAKCCNKSTFDAPSTTTAIATQRTTTTTAATQRTTIAPTTTKLTTTASTTELIISSATTATNPNVLTTEKTTVTPNTKTTTTLQPTSISVSASTLVVTDSTSGKTEPTEIASTEDLMTSTTEEDGKMFDEPLVWLLIVLGVVPVVVIICIVVKCCYKRQRQRHELPEGEQNVDGEFEVQLLQVHPFGDTKQCREYD